MSIYENMRNKRKVVEKNKEDTKTLPKCQMLAILGYKTCNQIKDETLHFNPIV